MKLILNELRTTLYQQITVGTKPIQLYAIRPHLYRHNVATGSLTVQVQDLNGNVVASSDTVAISAIGTLAYWHGYQRFLISAMLQKNTAYRIAVIPSGGYSFAETAYIGWCNDYDLRKVTASYTPNVGLNAALDMELWESKENIRRAG